MTANVLTMLPARARLLIYVVFGLLVIVQGAVAAGYDSLELSAPAWLLVASAVLKFLSVPVVALAAVAVTQTPPELASDAKAAWAAQYGTSLAEREAANPEAEDDGTDRGWGTDSGN